MATIVKFYKDGKKVKDITSIGYLPVDEDAVKDSRHLASSGSVIAAAALGEESMMANLPIADNTLRFSFGDPDYNPTEHWDGRAGTWVKKNTKFANIWDWTNESTSWATAFGGTTASPISPFMDVENNPVKILVAGDTSSVTDFSRCFQYAYGLVEVCPIDTSSATTTLLMFSHCLNVEYYPDFDLSSVNDCKAMFQVCWSLKKTPYLTLPTDHTVSLQNMFTLCNALEEITFFDTSMVSSMDTMFYCGGGAFSVNVIPLLESLNIPFVNDWEDPDSGTMYLSKPYTFGKFKTCPNFDTSKVTSMRYMFGGTSIESIPQFDFSTVENTREMFEGCLNLHIYDSVSLPNVTLADGMFAGLTQSLDIQIEIGKSCNYENMCSVHISRNTTTHLGLYKPKRSGLKSFNTDFSKVSNANGLFNGAEIVQIPDLTGIPASTKVTAMFKNCRDVKYGILEAYSLLSSQNNPHDNKTFMNCGIDTEEGRAALAQIPTSWGGTMEEEP